MMKFLRDILTSDAESTVYDLVRVMCLVGFVAGVSLVVYSVVWRGQPFDIEKFGLGIGLLIGAGGGAMWARKDIER